MTKEYRVYGYVTGIKYLGKVTANSEEEAQDKAFEKYTDEMYVSLCHQCSHQFDLDDISTVIAEMVGPE